MGSYTITIKGTGPHHNVPGNDEGDADKLGIEFVEQLRRRGHSIKTASFTQESTQCLRSPAPGKPARKKG